MYFLNKAKKLGIAIATMTAITACVALNINNSKGYNVEIDSLLSTWHPYKKIMYSRVPQEVLNESTEIGLTLGEVQNIVKTTYVEGKSPLYVNGILVVNKVFKLPSSFDDQHAEAFKAKEMMDKMKKSALSQSIYLNPFSVYRSYDRQSVLYNNYVARDGQSKADRYSARPGSSEHQTGLGFDIGGADSSKYASVRFNGSKEAQWLSENADKFGFILRFLDGKEDITGYMHESWHYRYIGTEYSTRIKNSGLALEEYLGLDRLHKIDKLITEV